MKQTKARPKKRFFGSLTGTVSYVGDIISPSVDQREWKAAAKPR